MRNDFFAHLETLPLGYFQAHRTGDLMSRATNDLNAVRMMIGPSIMYSANTLLTFVVALSVMISIDPRLTLLVAHPAAVRVDFGEAVRHRHPQALRADSGAAVGGERRRAGSAVRRPRRPRLPAGGRRSSSGSGVSIDEYLRRNRRLIVLQGFFFPSMGFFLGLGALVVVWLGSREVIAGRITRRAVRRVQRVSDDAELADDRVRLGHEHAAARHGVVEADARGARHRAGDCGRGSRTAERAKPNVRISRHSMSGIRGAIEFRDLVFSYGDTPVLKHVSATIEAGQTVALVGVTGSGKSTLISLLARLHDPPPGTVFIDGVDVREIPLADAARRDRLRAAGAVPVLGHARRQRRVRAGRAGRAGRGRARGGSRTA